MINQKAMAEAFAKANEKAASVRVKANGYRDGNAMHGACKTLRNDLVAAGVSEKGARKKALVWDQANRKAT